MCQKSLMNAFVRLKCNKAKETKKQLDVQAGFLRMVLGCTTTDACKASLTWQVRVQV